MEKVEQILLFEDSSNDLIPFFRYLCNTDWTVKTKNGIILETREVLLNKKELLNYCRIANCIKRFKYGYRLFYIENGIKYEIVARLGNYSTKKRDTPSTFIEKYFDLEADFYKEVFASSKYFNEILKSKKA